MDSLSHLSVLNLLDTHGCPITPTQPIKIVKSGVIFQELCHNGLPYDIAISWLQKAIRRGYYEQAVHCAYQIHKLGKIFTSHLLNRLLIIVSEDIGPAEMDLPDRILPLYQEAMELNNDDHEDQAMIPLILEMIYLLSESRKSRITDWLSHIAQEEKETEIYKPPDHCENISEMIKFAVDAAANAKHGYIQTLWDYLKTSAHGLSDIKALREMYRIRGAEYGVLFLIHAICLVWYYDDLKPPESANLHATIDVTKWEDQGKQKVPILNAAVDRHTLWGSRHLKRTFWDFLCHGSKLNNWTPFPKEEEIIQSLKDNCPKPKPDTSTPRPYQNALIDKAHQHYVINDESVGSLIMACGTGKTKSAYWIHKKLSESLDIRVTVIVFPFLEILQQFHQVWADMNYYNQTAYYSGIIASCRGQFLVSKYANYQYITNITSAKKFLDMPYRKLVFTTYYSIAKISEWDIKPDMVIYDEAHHYSSKSYINASIVLNLTATPKVYNPDTVITTYHLQAAIADGHLTDYRIKVLPDGQDDIDYLDYIFTESKKVIVYCSKAVLAKEMQETFSASSSSINSWFVNCKTLKDKRNEIYREFQEAGTRSVIFNCAILGEGVDLPACDAIYIDSGYSSPSRVVQAVGRPLRLYPGKAMSHIYMKSGKSLAKRISAIKVYDPLVESKVETIGEL